MFFRILYILIIAWSLFCLPTYAEKKDKNFKSSGTVSKSKKKRHPSSEENVCSGKADIFPVGTILTSILTEDHFQKLNGEEWSLMRGQSAAGSHLGAESVASVPDARGKFLRMANNGAQGDHYDPDNSRGLGSYQEDQFKEHTHSYIRSEPPGWGGASDDPGVDRPNREDNTGKAGSGAETRPKNISVNFFIKMNHCCSNNCR